MYIYLSICKTSPKHPPQKKTNLTALGAVRARGQGQAADGAARADAGGDDVLIELRGLLGGELDVVRVDIDLVLVGGLVPVPPLDHGVHEVLERLVRVLVSGDGADAEVRRVDPGLEGIIYLFIYIFSGRREENV